MINWDDPLNINKKPSNTQITSYTKPNTLNDKDEQENIAIQRAVDPHKSNKSGTTNINLSTDKKAIKTSDKRVINGITDINQLAPFKYPWAWEYFLNANKNHWTPLDINMTQDVHDYQHKLTDDEKHVYENVLAYLTTSDILAMRNIGLAVMEKMTAPELQIYQARQVYEEALHCYEEGTEVLTNKGFIDFRKINKDTLIAQYNKDGSIEFVPHLGITVDDFTGELVQFESALYHSSVTPNHRCVSFNTRKDNLLEITQASQLSPDHHNFPVAGKLKHHKTSSLDSITKLQIAYHAQGIVCDTKITPNNPLLCRWHLTQTAKIERLFYLVDKLNLDHTQSGEYLEVCIPANLNFNKDLSFIDLSKISYQWAREFIHELSFWNTLEPTESICYSSINQDHINLITSIGVLANYQVNTHITQTDTKDNCYTLTFIEKNIISGDSIKKSKKQYTGKVYSVGVPSTMIITRYKNKVCISGNTWTYQHCIETIGLNQEEIYNRYRVVPEINTKIQISNKRLNSVLRNDIDLTNRDELNNFIMAYSFFAGIFEGCWFYNGFTPIFSLQRRGLMRGTAEQFQYIMRDEVLHASFGIRVIKQIILENNVSLDPKAIRDMWDETEAAEMAYAHYILKNPILGYTSEDHIEQFRFIANRRARQLGFKEPFLGAKNRTPWLDEQANLRKEKNFFETRVTEYQTGGALNWD